MLIKSPGKIYPYGVNPKAISYIERADHTCQVAINGHPLYFFAGDARPGRPQRAGRERHVVRDRP
jgi:predicted lipoprotein with Yx(FWY)xxD motif